MPRGHLESHPTLVSLVQRSAHPILVTLLLFATTLAFGQAIDTGTIVLGVITATLVISIFPVVGIYASRRTKPLGEKLPRVLAGWALVIAVLSIIGFATKSTTAFSRVVLFTWAVSALLALMLTDITVSYALRQLRAHGRNWRRAIIAGNGELVGMLAERIRTAPEWGLRISGIFDDTLPRGSEAYGAPVLGGLSEVCGHVIADGISHVYVALPPTESEKAAHLLDELGDTTASVYLVPFVSALLRFNFRSQDMDGLPVYAVNETPFADAASMTVKRITDIVVSTMCLILFAPLFLFIAVGVKMSSPGPVLFRQRRSGLSGREFMVYKFRTMTVMEDGHDVSQAKRNDTRCTPFGAFLRRTSLDELPQFFNVLQGTMSMVGPRPHPLALNEQYRRLIRGYMLRHKIKPGITGWAQIHGLRGETDTLDKMERRVEFDLHYMTHWSFSLDLKILMKTPFVLFLGKNAY